MIKHLKILIVDDDPGVIDLLGAYLESRGYSVRTAKNGRDALVYLDDDQYDLVISDIEMAGINGFELLRQTRGKYPRIGIILMTGYTEAHPLSEALRAGADGYISKPFSLRKFSLIFEQAYWNALSREDWWTAHEDESQKSDGPEKE
ncbi:MAG TPA: response regulator [Candidatus Hydrogenedentes bacterium]|nr:response regulator [Candidatus Hydrogenedentota bacterium]HRK34201.1 response regulator [Candidatus Hydrogenedentota bacterium]